MLGPRTEAERLPVIWCWKHSIDRLPECTPHRVPLLRSYPRSIFAWRSNWHCTGYVTSTYHSLLAPLNGFEWHMSIDFPTISTNMCHSVWCGRVCLRMCFRSFFPDIRQLHMPSPQGRRGPWGYNHFEPRSSCLQGFEGAGGHFCMFFFKFLWPLYGSFEVYFRLSKASFHSTIWHY